MRAAVSRRHGLVILAILIGSGATFLYADAPADNPAAALLAKHEALRDRLANNPFNRPVYLESIENAGNLKGEVYGVVAHPFMQVAQVLREATNWCDILMLHLNVKLCRAEEVTLPHSLNVYIGRKYWEPLDATYRVEYAFRVAAESSDYLQVLLTADNGPFNTANYRVLLEALALPGERTFLHLNYSYGYGALAKLAMEAYLLMLGRGKVGFTIVGSDRQGQPVYVGGLRGAEERNVMRYYLAVDAYLDALSVPLQQRLETRLRDWFALTEHHALQLHELEEKEYLDIKRREYQRKTDNERMGFRSLDSVRD
jgi:hypothetical protein